MRAKLKKIIFDNKNTIWISCVLLVSLFFIQCTDRKKILYADMWQVGSVKSDTVNLEDELLGNLFYFDMKGNASLPGTFSYPNCFDEHWQAKLRGDQIDSLFIKTPNKLFEGDYKVRFLRNNVNPRLYLELKSKNLEIVLYTYFKTKRERDSYVDEFGVVTYEIPNNYFPQLKMMPDKRKCFD